MKKNEIIGYSIIIKDITERKKIEEEFKNTAEELSKLNEIAEFIHGTRDENEVFNLMLTGVTVGEGFRYNRAFLFLYNEKEMVLKGVNAVGPSNPEEASKIWPKLLDKKSLRDVLNIYKDNVAKTDIAIKQIVRNIKIHISNENNILVKSFKTSQHYRVEKKDGYNEETLRLLEKLNTDHFIVIPLIGKSKALGVLVVDNAISHKKISNEEIELLRLLAHQTSLAIENAKLYRSIEEKLNLLEELYSEQKENQEKLIQMERLATVGRVTAKIAHEIRNPLVSVGGYARLIRKEFEKVDINSDYIKIIIEEVARLEKILADIGNFCKSEHVSNKKLEKINNTIRKSIRIINQEFNEQGTVVEEFLSDNLPELFYDDWEISQVFINLFRNAIQAMPQNGKIIIRSYTLDNAVKVEIADTGSGVPENMIKDIFNPFFTTKPTGLGLGLTICKQILSQHNCSIDVKSRLNKGTTFILSFPFKLD